MADETLPLSMKTEWTELMFMQIRAGNTAMYVFGLAVVCVFLALAALVRKLVVAAGGDPGRAVVPALLGGRRAVHAQVGQYLRADRPGRAGRAGVQERDPDRRIRQATAPRRPAARFEATREACRLRLRPIMMTSFAFILGVVPLVVAEGPAPRCANRSERPSSAACSA